MKLRWMEEKEAKVDGGKKAERDEREDAEGDGEEEAEGEILFVKIYSEGEER